MTCLLRALQITGVPRSGHGQEENWPLSAESLKNRNLTDYDGIDKNPSDMQLLDEPLNSPHQETFLPVIEESLQQTGEQNEMPREGHSPEEKNQSLERHLAQEVAARHLSIYYEKTIQIATKELNTGKNNN